MLETILFYVFAAGVIAFALGVILARSAVYSVLSLVAAMGMMAALFVLLKAFLVATILILVYAGAILVLFLFVIMLIDFKSLSLDWDGFKLHPLLAAAVGGLIFSQAYVVIKSIERPEMLPVQGTTQAIGRTLFNNYVLPFELTSFLLLSAVVAVVVLARKESK